MYLLFEIACFPRPEWPLDIGGTVVPLKRQLGFLFLYVDITVQYNILKYCRGYVWKRYLKVFEFFCH